MKNQVIVSIGREHGSGGHYIAQMLSERLQIKLYDRELFNELVKTSGYSEEIVQKLDEKPINFLFSRRIGQYSNSLEEIVAQQSFKLIQDMADTGASFVVVGRCAEFVLRDNPNLLRVFICGKDNAKIARIMKTDDVDRATAIERIHDIDKKRRTYHDHYCDTKWGYARHYDLTINSSKLGLEATAEALANYVRFFQQQD